MDNGERKSSVSATFGRFAARVAHWVGSTALFFSAVAMVIVWGLTGPIFHYSDTWQLVINTATTIITFLMVFLIQNTQNRDARAIHLKLDEIIRSIQRARNEMIDIEELGDDELQEMAKKYQRLREESERRKAERADRQGKISA